MILALDIALNTGHAFGNEDNIVFGTRSFHAFTNDCAALGQRFHNYVESLIGKYEPTHFVIEAPILNIRKANKEVLYRLYGLAWEAHRIAHFHQLPRAEYQPKEIKQFITGNGNAKKDDVIHAMKCRGYNPRSDHEADAGALLLLHESVMRSNNG